ncbi:MAG: TAT-variant-translocated molybdopterin oxidoreductase [Cytophagaceae bacterium]|nr:TAT-variant-translocated molybdopterin oxidoreductase [Cytophagaceae bacterium]
MKENTKVYWKGLEELNQTEDFVKTAHNEFPEYLPLKSEDNAESGPDRRDFLKMLGFSVAAVTLAACEAPVKKAIPYVNKPEEIDPGIANYYATTYIDGSECLPVVVKTREGRPIKIEGNKLSSVYQGGTSVKAQASVLGLYDTARLAKPTIKGKSASWDKIDAEITSSLETIASAGGEIRIVTPSIYSPSTKRALSVFASKFPTAKHIQYDAISYYGILKANQITFGQYAVPSYDFSKADVIVSLGADFLGTWISPTEFARQYAATRKLSAKKKTMSRHYQFETGLSLTGSNADYRVGIKPSEEAAFVSELYNKLSSNKISVSSKKNDVLNKAATDLLNARGKSLVVSGSNDPSIQAVVNEINVILGNYGSTISFKNAYQTFQGNDEQMNTFVDELVAGTVKAVIFYGVNPVYDYYRGAEIEKVLKNTLLTVSFADRADETASLCTFIAPDSHYLESWNDAEPKIGFYSLAQPTIKNIFDTRQAQSSLLKWAGAPSDFYAFVKSTWTSSILNGQSWDKALHDGVLEPGISSTTVEPASNGLDVTAISTSFTKNYTAVNGIELKVYEKIGLGNGAQANNPWLQEFPDPISKATWDNYIALPISYAKEKGLEQGALVKVTNGKSSITLPVLIQPGQAKGTASIALGYGRSKSGKCGDGVGQNVFTWLKNVEGFISTNAGTVTIEPTGEVVKLALTQTHQTLMARPIIQDATLEEYKKNPSAGRFIPLVTNGDGKKVAPAELDIWKDQHHQPNHLWSMSIDLNSCIGCGACVIACQAENNVPVVGKKEVINAREMHWIRIDRYYSSEFEPKETGVYFDGDVVAMEDPSENPQVTFQPMMCQHCNHAPCETVCPVAATTHSSEGLNQMTYNRCIGTRYCANNCPYKVRRFNWFKYFDNGDMFDKNVTMNTSLGRMVLNPDVTVRSRGVMEKCSFCVQKIQEGKLKAKKEKRKIEDGEVQTACAASCATGAIVFGDYRDLNSQVYKERNEENKERTYTVLEELNVQPNVTYLTKIRNISKA